MVGYAEPPQGPQKVLMPVYYCAYLGIIAEGRLRSWGHLMSCGGPNSKRCLRNSMKCFEAMKILRSSRAV